ncbi:MFS transporter [Helicobacter didelphidarum]|uniref:MFS transporter n=1 Tax=Helicobacter didelphidarum TaxID=2040648 RepID=A0A3D8IPG7_9HELI|nr:MFS transporter [Helicobacter didelphidarum]RDU67139.1 MFS transporter [Helicobacter didelphidarum]
MPRKKIFLLNCLTMVVIALNLRAPITFISPLVGDVQAHFYLSSAAVGFLTTLPLFAFGIFSFLVSRFQHIKAMIVGLICIIIGEFIRAYGEFLYSEHLQNILKSAHLFFGTMIMGAGIAVANVLLPTFVKSKFPNKIPQMMGIYSFTLNISAIIGLAVALPLMHYIGLLNTMAIWILIALFALLLYIPQARNGRIKRIFTHKQESFNIFKNLNAWKITLFMGFQSFMFYGVIAWLPKIIEEKGYGIDFATTITLITQFIALPTSLIVPVILASLRNKYKSLCMFIICSLYGVGMLLILFFSQDSVLYCAAVILGIPMGSVFTIALLFITQKSSSAFIALKLSAMAQGCGYLIASVSPLLIGKLHDIFHGFQQGIMVFICTSFVICIFGYLANNVTTITDEDKN